jgi:hypothetical protein
MEATFVKVHKLICALRHVFSLQIIFAKIFVLLVYGTMVTIPQVALILKIQVLRNIVCKVSRIMSAILAKY